MQAGTGILDFIALDTEEIVSHMNKMSESITKMIEQKVKAPNRNGIIQFDFSDVTKSALHSTLTMLHDDNFFLFLVN